MQGGVRVGLVGVDEKQFRAVRFFGEVGFAGQRLL